MPRKKGAQSLHELELIPCRVCRGKGFFRYNPDYSTVPATCDNCNGHGFVYRLKEIKDPPN